MKPLLQWLPCRSRKIPYSTEREARVSMRKADRQTGRRMVPYHCRFCDQWHLTHKGGSDR